MLSLCAATGRTLRTLDFLAAFFRRIQVICQGVLHPNLQCPEKPWNRGKKSGDTEIGIPAQFEKITLNQVLLIIC